MIKIGKMQIYLPDICFLLYLMTTMAHCSGSGSDHILSLVSFGLVAAAFLMTVIKKMRLRFDFVNKCMVVFLALIFASYFWAAYPQYVFSPEYSNILMEGPQMLLVGLFLSQRIKNKADVKFYINLYLIAVAYMLVSIIVRTPLSDYLSGSRIGTVTGLWVNALAKIYVMALGFIYYVITESKGIKKYALYLMAIVLIAFTFLTGSKNGILMFIMITFLTYFLRGSLNGKIRIAFITVLLIAAVMFLIFNVPILYKIIGSRMESFLDMLSYNDVSYDSSSETRSYLMGYALEMFLQRPIFGWGFANVAGYVASKNFFIVTYAHSNYLELLADLGIVGTVAFYLPHMVTIKKLLKETVVKKRKDMLLCAATALLTVLLITDYISVNITTTYYLVVIQLLYYVGKYCIDQGGAQ